MTLLPDVNATSDTTYNDEKKKKTEDVYDYLNFSLI
jgi:hypothetical protein